MKKIKKEKTDQMFWREEVDKEGIEGALLSRLKFHKRIILGEAAQLIGISENTLLKHFRRLVEKGLCKEITSDKISFEIIPEKLKKNIKITICASCLQSSFGKDKDGKKICAICDSTDIKEVEISEPPTCVYCKAKWLPRLKGPDIPPLYSYKNNTYYCGCRGWD
jgi:hypothetical protein